MILMKIFTAITEDRDTREGNQGPDIGRHTSP